jgi:hypothetical protein
MERRQPGGKGRANVDPAVKQVVVNRAGMEDVPSKDQESEHERREDQPKETRPAPIPSAAAIERVASEHAGGDRTLARKCDEAEANQKERYPARAGKGRAEHERR